MLVFICYLQELFQKHKQVPLSNFTPFSNTANDIVDPRFKFLILQSQLFSELDLKQILYIQR